MPKPPDNKASRPAPRRLGLVSQMIAQKADNLDRADTRNSEALIVSLERIRPNPRQPRRFYDAERDRELAENIKEHGILEPLLVRLVSENQYEIVAGERRYRAARLAGKHSVPVIVKEYGEEQAQLVAVIENLQRQDLDPRDEAHYFKFLADQYNYSYRKIAALVHRSYGYVNERMRLLNLPEEAPESGDINHKRPEKDQKLEKSQTKAERKLSAGGFGGRQLRSFEGWLDKAQRQAGQLSPADINQLRLRLAELRQKIDSLEQQLSD